MLILEEKEKGLFHLIRTTKKGRVGVLAAKLFALYTVCIISYLVLYSGNFLSSYLLYGSPDVNRLIQSIEGFIGSTLNISIVTYLIVYSVTKILAYFFIASVLMVLCVVARTGLFVYALTAGISSISTLLYITIQDNSYLSPLKFINIVSVLNTNKLYMNYLDINVFGYPINIITISTSLITVGTGFFFISSIVLFVKQKNLIYEKSRVLQWIKRKLPFQNHKGYKLMFYESHKILFVHKAYLILLLLVIIGIYSYNSYRKPYMPYDRAYKSYVMKVEGTLNDKTYQFVNEEQAYFDNLNVQLSELYNSLKEKKIDYITYYYMESSIKQELQKQIGFFMLKNKISEIEPYYQNKSDIKPWIIYDTGYNQLFDIVNNADMNRSHFLFILAMIACMAPIYANENRIGINKLLQTTKHGRTKSFRSRITCGAVLTLLVFVAVYLPCLANILQNYGIGGIHAPLQSLSGYNKFPFKISILSFLFIVYTIRLVFAQVLMVVLICISYNAKNVSSVFTITGGLFLIPYIIKMFNISFAAKLLWNPFILVDILGMDTNQVRDMVLMIGNLVIVAILASIYIYRTYSKISLGLMRKNNG